MATDLPSSHPAGQPRALLLLGTARPFTPHCPKRAFGAFLPCPCPAQLTLPLQHGSPHPWHPCTPITASGSVPGDCEENCNIVLGACLEFCCPAEDTILSMCPARTFHICPSAHKTHGDIENNL